MPSTPETEEEHAIVAQIRAILEPLSPAGRQRTLNLVRAKLASAEHETLHRKED